MKKWKIRIGLALVVAGMSAAGEGYGQVPDHVTAGGFYACVSRENLKEVTSALAKNDIAEARLVPNCFETKAGIPLSLLDYRSPGPSEVRLHMPGGGTPLVVWTSNHNIKKP